MVTHSLLSIGKRLDQSALVPVFCHLNLTEIERTVLPAHRVTLTHPSALSYRLLSLFIRILPFAPILIPYFQRVANSSIAKSFLHNQLQTPGRGWGALTENPPFSFVFSRRFSAIFASSPTTTLVIANFLNALRGGLFWDWLGGKEILGEAA